MGASIFICYFRAVLKSPMDDLNEILTEILEKHDVPSVAAAVVVDGELCAAGAVGVRKRGDDTPVTVNDKYHIGSCTKAMTATLAGVLVERGLLSWETPLLEVFPELDIHPGYQPVTLKQLLSHTAGMPAFTDSETEDPELVKTVFSADGMPMNDRLEVVVPTLLCRGPRTLPGSTFEYSNMGYVTAGAVFERVTRTSFEILLQTEVFTPLDLTSAGFGAAGTAGQVDEPWGHVPEPVEPGPNADIPPVLSPAGCVHMSVADFARHAAFHLSETPKLVSKKTLEVLHTPVLDDYALGWGVLGSDWAPGKLLGHAGSNRMSHAVNLLAPALGFAIVTATNLGTEVGSEALDDVVQTMKRHFLGVK